MKTRRWLAIAMMLGCVSATRAQEPAPKPPQGAETWAGRTVVLKRPGIKIGHSDAAGKQVYTAELTSLSYLVKAEQEGYLQVQQGAAVGWFDKNEALLPDAAIKYFGDKATIAATVNPKDGTALAYLGWAYREKKDYPSAIKMYDQAVARQPTPDWHNNRGILFLESGNYDKAIADFTEAIRLKPGFLIAVENRSIANQSAGRIAEALADLAEVMRSDDKNAQLLVRRGRLRAMNKEFKEAEADFNQAVALEPKKAEFLVQRGDLFAEQKQYDKANDDYAAAAKLAPNDPEPLVHRSNVFVDQKKFPNALVDLDAAVKLDPRNAEILIARGYVNFLAGNYEATVGDYEAAAKAEPRNPLVYNSRAWMLATCPDDKYRDGKKAEEYARKSIEMTQGKDPMFRDTLAAALAEQGRFDEAVKEQEAVVMQITQGQDAIDARSHLDSYRQKKAYRQVIEKN
jgi:tetratricopeptide (TPR) repeat protein